VGQVLMVAALTKLQIAPLASVNDVDSVPKVIRALQTRDTPVY
jgi:hypothetical protein